MALEAETSVRESSMIRLRLDRLASVYLFRRLSSKLASSSPSIPILMYHSIQEGTQHRNAYYDTNTSPRTFALQMSYLRENGYLAVTLDQAWHLLEGGAATEKHVAITFDDGFRDFYTAAFPILSKNNLTATVFLITGATSDERSRFKGQECLTWKEVRELHSQCIQFGSHTMSHPELKDLSAAAIEEEVVRSKQTIEEKIGSRVTSFSYPFAFPETRRQFVGRLREALLRNGYENGVSTVIGTAQSQDDPFFLPRLPVNTWDDLLFFQAKLERGYDWLHSIQRASKLMTMGIA